MRSFIVTKGILFTVLLYTTHLGKQYLIDRLIDSCLPPTLAVFQLYRGVN